VGEGEKKQKDLMQFGKLHYRDFKKTCNENKKAECEEHGAKRCKSGFSKARIEIYISIV